MRDTTGLFLFVSIFVLGLATSCGRGLVIPCSSKAVLDGGTCGCQINLPVTTLSLPPHNSELTWPFGAHGQSGHPEGHPGIDFISSTSIDVVAVADGVVSKIEDGNTSEYLSGSHSVYVLADCGVTYDYQPIVKLSTITVGARVTRGQKLGVMAQMVPAYGAGRYSFHFDTRGDKTGSTYESFCPASLMSATDQATLLALVSSSTYNEKVARTVSISCRDGSTRSFTYAAEAAVCNAHLSAAQAAELDACLQLGSERPIW